MKHRPGTIGKGHNILPSAVPVNTVLPTITGSPIVGQTLSLNTGAWTNSPTSYARQWKADGVNIGGATGATYVVLIGDLGKNITGTVLASNAIGPALSAALSAAVGPVTSASSVPASIATPIVGTDLTAVWNLQFSGTGPLNAPSNGAWAGHIDAYLTSVGFFLGNYSQLCVNCGAGTVNIARYDFTGAPEINANGTGTIIFTDCTFANGGNVTWPTDLNKNIDLLGSLTLHMVNCVLDGTTFYQGSGTTLFSYSKFTNQLQNLGDVGYLAAGVASTTYDHCFIPGGGVQPPPLAHVELSRVPCDTYVVTRQFSCTNCMVNISADGQANSTDWGSGWTGIWSIGAMTITLQNSIIIGAIAVNANPANPDVVGPVLAYGLGSVPTFTNCAMEPGVFGYSLNENGAPNRPTDGGGNRSFANVALTIADFG